MIDKIYTIPVTEAFSEDCECPVCLLEDRFENETAEYTLGPSLMEPEHRIETNDKGFCARHFKMLYDKQSNRLGLGLILDTYMTEQNNRLAKITGDNSKADNNVKQKKGFLSGLSAAKAAGRDAVRTSDMIVEYLDKHEKKCVVCGKMNHTMDRYIEVIMHLYFQEKDFRARFNEGKGFCIPHYKRLINGSKKYHSASKSAEFLSVLNQMQIDNLERIQEEVNWFTQKFDYRNNDEPWGNSKDALPRGINKMTGAKGLK